MGLLSIFQKNQKKDNFPTYRRTESGYELSFYGPKDPVTGTDFYIFSVERDPQYPNSRQRDRLSIYTEDKKTHGYIAYGFSAMDGTISYDARSYDNRYNEIAEKLHLKSSLNAGIFENGKNVLGDRFCGEFSKDHVSPLLLQHLESVKSSLMDSFQKMVLYQMNVRDNVIENSADQMMSLQNGVFEAEKKGKMDVWTISNDISKVGYSVKTERNRIAMEDYLMTLKPFKDAMFSRD